jgi:hypothetical protein
MTLFIACLLAEVGDAPTLRSGRGCVLGRRGEIISVARANFVSASRRMRSAPDRDTVGA